MRTQKGIFITGTDTDVGKTIATLVLGKKLQAQGLDVGVMKPVQCSGDDASFLKKQLDIADPIEEINPYFAKEPLSPHLAFKRQKTNINISKILSVYKKLSRKHDIVLVEGAGGLMVPLKKNYFMADLAKDLGLDVIIVSHLGLGTINHTLLTIEQARRKGLGVRGVVFSEKTKSSQSIPEQTNPRSIKEFGSVAILGTIPYLKDINLNGTAEKYFNDINFKPLINNDLANASRCGQAASSRSSVRVTRRLPLLAKLDKQYLWHPFTQMQDWNEEEPLIIDEAEGHYLIDTDGNRYLDGVSSLWVNVHGHRHKTIDQAIKDQIDRLSHSTLLGLSNTPAVVLAKKLVEVTPKGLDKVFYSDNGSTAVEIAIKMAYQYWQNTGKTKKTNIVHLANSYHGDTLGSVSVGGIEIFHQVYRDLIFKTIKLDFPDCYRVPRDKKYPEFAFESCQKFERKLKKDGKNIAAFVVEPLVQGAAGMIMWPKGILKKMSELCKQYDVIFIADEVATGFGRTGKMFACEHEGVIPDIMCLAKGLTGGYLPLAATVTSQRIYDGFLHHYEDQKTFFHGHTYTGNPLCCAAALANLEVFEKECTLKKMEPKIKFLDKELKMFYNLPHVGDVRQRGFMVGIELVLDKESKTPFPWEERIGVKVCQRVREGGVILRPLGNVIVLMPALSMSRSDLKRLLDATYWAIEQVIGTT